MNVVTDRPDVLTDIELDLPGRRVGKVRVSYDLGEDRRLFITTDRLSAFDRVVAAVPGKDQVLINWRGGGLPTPATSWPITHWLSPTPTRWWRWRLLPYRWK